jgi:hypothetical protein
VHEAGHVVTALAWVGPVAFASIKSVEGQHLGLVGTDDRRNPATDPDFIRSIASARSPLARRYARALARALARYSLGGYAAESVHLGGFGLDILQTPSVDLTHATIALRAGEGWDDFDDSTESEADLRREFRRAHSFVRRNWTLVEAIASALIAQGTLYEPDLADIVRGNGGALVPGPFPRDEREWRAIRSQPMERAISHAWDAHSQRWGS